MPSSALNQGLGASGPNPRQVGVSSGAAAPAPPRPPRSQLRADWPLRGLSAVTCRSVLGALAVGGGAGMDPQAVTGQGPGEPNVREAPSAEVSATGWGTPAPATTLAGSRGARALRRGGSPGKRWGRASTRTAWPVTAGAGTRLDPSPRLWRALEGEENRRSSAVVNGRKVELVALRRGLGDRWERRGEKDLCFNLEDLWPLVGMCI